MSATDDNPSFDDPESRRSFLKILGASIALAGLDGCTFFTGSDIIPYVTQPEEIIPGKPLFYASSVLHNGFAYGILVETHLGRPTKIEGNPVHPASLGGSSPFMQANLLSLYDPERGKGLIRRGVLSTWDDFYRWLSGRVAQWEKDGGKGLCILTETVTSPSLGKQLLGVISKYPKSRWHSYQPVGREATLQGASIAFGKKLNPCYRFENTKVIFSLDCDFLSPEEAGHLHYARKYSDGRRLRANRHGMNRLYQVESNFSITGAMADHRLAVEQNRISDVMIYLAQELGISLRAFQKKEPHLTDQERFWISEGAKDLKQTPGESLILVANRQPPGFHALAYLLNEHLNNLNKTLYFTPLPEFLPPEPDSSLASLIQDMNAGQVETLLILGGNPVFNSPAELGFSQALNRVPNRLKSGLEFDETAFQCEWFLPESHFLESWGDGRAFDGTVSTFQPVIQPLYDTKTPLEILLAFTGNHYDTGQVRIKETFRELTSSLPPLAQSLEMRWKQTLQEGVLKGSAFEPVPASVSREALENYFSHEQSPAHLSGLEVSFYPDPFIWDGKYANNAWLQELPKPLTQLTWDNAAVLSPETAEVYQVKTGDLVSLEYKEGARSKGIQIPALVLKGHAHHSISLYFGYGRSVSGSVGSKKGFDVYPFMGKAPEQLITGVTLTKTGVHYPLAMTQIHSTLEGTQAVRFGTYQVMVRNPKEIVPFENQPQASFFKNKTDLDPEEAWAMVIDLTVCIGCKACTVACQAENNIPVVGKDQVLNRREMHWIRVDHYFKESSKGLKVLFQPVPCMHCEKAPCEIVCPTEATAHTPSGLNAMVYNRCVGTRYCSNNCPYKVRRFNFLQFSDMSSPLPRLMRNPDVTVRSRGVMEKCTYCIQRINAVKIQADIEKRSIRDGEVVPACQQACPTQAIVFGNKADSTSQVARLREEPLNYELLHELSTRPRTTYLARITHPNPKLAEPSESENGSI